MVFLLLFLIQTGMATAQDSTVVNKARLKTVLYGTSSAYGVALVGLNELWYKKEPRTGFHFFNDNNEWLQIDKIGHSYTAYTQSLLGIKLMKWSGLSDRKSALYGGLSGLVFQTPIEFLDAYSTAWGFSWGDIGANVFGAGLATSQLYFWGEERITLKYSYRASGLASQRPSVLGENLTQRLLKDYNAQTYWLSVNPSAFMSKEAKFPVWLNVAMGYGANNLIYAKPKDNLKILNLVSSREYYLAPDINFRRIKTNKQGLKMLFWLLDLYHLPLPALKFSNQKLKLLFQ